MATFFDVVIFVTTFGINEVSVIDIPSVANAFVIIMVDIFKINSVKAFVFVDVIGVADTSEIPVLAMVEAFNDMVIMLEVIEIAFIVDIIVVVEICVGDRGPVA